MHAIVSPPSECLWKTLADQSRQCLTAPPQAVVAELSVIKFFDAGHTTSYILKSGVTHQNFTEGRDLSHQISTFCAATRLQFDNRRPFVMLAFENELEYWNSDFSVFIGHDKYTEIRIPIFQFIFERQHDEWTTIVKLKPSCSTISICCPILRQTTGPIFTNILPDIAALVVLLNHAYTRHYPIPFLNARASEC